MNEPDTHRQLPAVTVPLQPVRPEYLNLMAIVLSQSPDAIIEDASCLDEGLAYQCRKAVNQRAGDERGEDIDDIGLKGTDARPECVAVEPVGFGFGEDAAQGLRRVASTDSS